MAIIAYLRVSTDEQTNSGLGMDAQLDAITRSVGAPDAIYRDEGYSGSDPKRPALLQALDTLKTNDVFAIGKRDRLARDVYLAMWVEKEVKKRGARIVSASGEGTENDDPTNVLMRHLVDAFAEYERNVIGARTKSALAQKRVRGEKTGGTIPFGFRLEDDGVHLVEDQDEQAVIARIQKLRDKGYSLRSIGTELENAGILTKTGKQVWNPKTVRQLLRVA